MNIHDEKQKKKEEEDTEMCWESLSCDGRGG